MNRIAIDFRYVEIEYELWALGHMLAIIQPAIERLSEQDESETIESLRRSGWQHDEAEVDIALQDVREKRDYVLPRFMRGPFVVALWACFESGVEAVARTLHAETKAPIALHELRADSFLARARRYYDALLGLPLDPDDARTARLADLYRVRNALAHANGLREGMTADEWARLQDVVLRHRIELDGSRGVIVLTHEYVQGAFDDVNESLRSLVTRARAVGR